MLKFTCMLRQLFKRGGHTHLQVANTGFQILLFMYIKVMFVLRCFHSIEVLPL